MNLVVILVNGRASRCLLRRHYFTPSTMPRPDKQYGDNHPFSILDTDLYKVSMSRLNALLCLC